MSILAKRATDDYDVHTGAEEIWHAATHGFGAILAVVALVFLLLKATATGGATAITAVSIYGGSAIFLYLASAVYHACFKFAFQPALEVVDHAAIYLKIAGSYTPFALITLPTGPGLVILVAVWALAVIGVVAQIVFHVSRKLDGYRWISLASYIGMGWIGLFVVRELWDGLSPTGFFWLIAGGVCFTVGAAFFAWKSRAYTHTIFHLFVILGSACHFAAIYGYVLQHQEQIVALMG